MPMQEPQAAVEELRRAINDLGMVGAMLPSTGLPLHLGHGFYDTVYREAADLDCVLAIHGGSNKTIGIDTGMVAVGEPGLVELLDPGEGLLDRGAGVRAVEVEPIPPTHHFFATRSIFLLRSPA